LAGGVGVVAGDWMWLRLPLLLLLGRMGFGAWLGGMQWPLGCGKSVTSELTSMAWLPLRASNRRSRDGLSGGSISLPLMAMEAN